MFGECYSERMKPEQTVIAKWMLHVSDRTGMKWNEWAKKAREWSPSLSATTLSRAVKDDYKSVTSVETLHALARAANVPSVLDFLEGDAVSVAGLKPVLEELLPLGPKGRWSETDVEHLVAAISYGLSLPTNDPATPTSEDAYDVAARAAADRFRDLSATA